jgi:hypothetical protein
METEGQICRRYEAEFAKIAILDRRYYLTRCASLDERREYAARRAQMEEMRSRFYAELADCRLHIVAFRHCRTFRRNRRPAVHFV